ncbi:MAG TPA: hypothetical protein VIK91_08380 [Nannocystis sp.]
MPPRRSTSLCLVALGWALVPAPALAGPAPPPVPGALPQNVKAALSDVALEPAGGGRLRHRGQGFTAYIHPDGSVEFKDHGGSGEINLLGFDPLRRRIREPEPERYDPVWMGVVEQTVYPMGRVPLLGTIGGRFGGLADGRRKDRHKREKAAFLAATEQLRFEMATRWYRAQIERELAELGGQLAEVWRDRRLSLAERKRLIFERWADSEPPATSGHPLDTLRARAARIARAKIEAFVRVVAPPGSPEAFTEAELQQLNRGRSGDARFRPYDAKLQPEEELLPPEPPAGESAPMREAAPPEPQAQAIEPVGPDADEARFRPVPRR